MSIINSTLRRYYIRVLFFFNTLVLSGPKGEKWFSFLEAQTTHIQGFNQRDQLRTSERASGRERGRERERQRGIERERRHSQRERDTERQRGISAVSNSEWPETKELAVCCSDTEQNRKLTEFLSASEGSAPTFILQSVTSHNQNLSENASIKTVIRWHSETYSSQIDW